MINKFWFYLFCLFLIPLGVKAKCLPDQLALVSDKTTTVLDCLQFEVGKHSFLLVIKNETKGKERGIGIEVFQHKKMIFTEFALGEVLDQIYFDGTKRPFIIADITGNGDKDICIKTLNERTANLFCFQYNPIAKNFIPIEVVMKNKEHRDMIVGTLDYPIKVRRGMVKVFWNKQQAFVYKVMQGQFVEQ